MLGYPWPQFDALGWIKNFVKIYNLKGSLCG